MRITHLGHACVLVETGGARILLDPGGFSSFEDQADLDAIVVTHAHPDHLDAERLPALLEASPDAALLAEPETAGTLRERGLQPRPLAPADEVPIGSAVVVAVGGQHAVIHADIPRIGNVGVLLRAPGEPTFFHPGDAYDTTPEGVDVLAAPLNAPWAALKETVEFVRAVGPRVAFPIHDGLVKDAGRGMYLNHMRNLAPEGTEVRDLRGAGAVEL